MKCIQCGTDNNLKDRTANNGRCKNCSHSFVFEPTSMGKIRFTDAFFAKVIEDISANDTLNFTYEQFFYLLNKRLIKKRKRQELSSFIFLTIIGFILSLFVFKLVVLAIIIAFGGALAIYLKNSSQKLTSFIITKAKFRQWCDRWERFNPATVTKILPPPREDTITGEVDSDIAAYSFDRVVVCDSSEIAQLLIMNNFHFEHNCAVVSTTGYPQNIFATVMRMLRRNDELKVYALHDASPRGVRLIHHLKTSPNWFGESTATIYDLGLQPHQVLKSGKFFIRQKDELAREAQQLSTEFKQNLSAKELAWLESGKLVELESFTPRKILQVVAAGIAKSQALESGFGTNNGDMGSDFDDRDRSDAGLIIFANDSFG